MLSIDSRRMSLASPDTPLYRYLLAHQPPEHPALSGLRLATQGIEGAGMQIGLDQAHFMAFMVKVLGARRVIELGTFTGYSALAMALALPPDGGLIACDVNEAWAAVGRPFFADEPSKRRHGVRLDESRRLRGQA